MYLYGGVVTDAQKHCPRAISYNLVAVGELAAPDKESAKIMPLRVYW